MSTHSFEIKITKRIRLVSLACVCLKSRFLALGILRFLQAFSCSLAPNILRVIARYTFNDQLFITCISCTVYPPDMYSPFSLNFFQNA